MIDYKNLQARCQRGELSLCAANNLLAECRAAIGRLIAENERVETENEQLQESHEQVCTNYNQASYASEERGKKLDQLKAEYDELEKAAMSYAEDLQWHTYEVDRLKAENEALRNSLMECTNSLQGEMLQKFGGQLPEDMHPVTRREYDRDVAEVSGYRAALGHGEQP
ncbi:hypothetical protein [Pseudomonas protegens]|uniref:hypothetical protein n=1 Tax=Pseudomonas protegens TaxID=380021 RepID=UPI001B3188B1|nr:hypothetical protein [Pseudomonas protegens]MBP5100417.1 hypothetical protein [Pseudomonas protegens]QTU06104.1 hypothetical protein HUT25_10215 [Pseudomonas protegens]QTU12414.1 hypothetical protein HUT23_10905 [Pseudomonas protegens]QTU40208.1 hypothetical protein HUT24_21395 [Pseudomonas protegens]